MHQLCSRRLHKHTHCANGVRIALSPFLPRVESRGMIRQGSPPSVRGSPLDQEITLTEKLCRGSETYDIFARMSYALIFARVNSRDLFL